MLRYFHSSFSVNNYLYLSKESKLEVKFGTIASIPQSVLDVVVSFLDVVVSFLDVVVSFKILVLEICVQLPDSVKFLNFVANFRCKENLLADI